MANVMADSVSRAKGFILIIWPMTALLAFIGMRLFWEDTQTTIAGYKVIGTAKVGDTETLGLMVALLYQLAPVALYYWYSRNTSNKVVLFVGLFCNAMDIYYDYNFKIMGFQMVDGVVNSTIQITNEMRFATISETVGIYTLGSEMMVTWCLGFLWEGMDEFGAAMASFLPSFIGLFAKLLDGTFTGGKKVMTVLEKHAPSISLNGDDDERTVGVTVNGKPQGDMFGGGKRT